MMHLVLGLGEIGTAIKAVLEKTSTSVGFKDIDKEQHCSVKYDVLHVCFPYSDKFVDIVKAYRELYGNVQTIVIIHATVPIGTCDALEAVSSPVRGIHPHLIEGIMTFVKYFGGRDAYKASRIFEACGIKTRVLERAKDCEAFKLIDTTQFGWQIILNKLIHKWCKENDINFEFVYREANQSYNLGYTMLDQPQFVRPWMDYVPGKIGGHCVLPNCDILTSELSQIVQAYNEKIND